jgi:protein gp37
MKTISDEFIDKTWATMAACPQHTFLILTKRPGRMLSAVNAMVAKYGILPNVWLGCTIVNQQEADEKIPRLLSVPGQKWLSIEPMLGPIDLKPFLGFWQWSRSENFQTWVPHEPSPIDAVVLGGETGPGARPLHPDWVRSVRDQCAAAGVPFYFKQWGKIQPAIKDLVGNERPVPMDVIRGTWNRRIDGQEHNELAWKK